MPSRGQSGKKIRYAARFVLRAMDFLATFFAAGFAALRAAGRFAVVLRAGAFFAFAFTTLFAMVSISLWSSNQLERKK